jgi:acyl dehydratase
VTSSILDPDSSNKLSGVHTTVSGLADLSILETDAPDPVGAGDTLTYTLSVTNAGPSDAEAVSVRGRPAGSRDLRRRLGKRLELRRELRHRDLHEAGPWRPAPRPRSRST